jgi:hypothetical protein
MTDAELLQLLHSKLPEELSPAELQLLKSRLRESDTLRQALLEDLRFEAHFAAAMGDFQLNPEQLAATAAARQQRPAHPVRAFVFVLLFWGWVLARIWHGKLRHENQNPSRSSRKMCRSRRLKK